MGILKKIPTANINRIRYSKSTNDGLAYKEFGEHNDVQDYTDEEITQMFYGMYPFKKMLLVDGDYFISLTDVSEIICVLDKATYYKTPTHEDFKTNTHNRISNIRTFYIKDYFLITQNEVNGILKHKITNLLHKVGAFKHGRNEFSRLFSYKNQYKILYSFKQGYYSRDLFHPIKIYINDLFFSDGYYLSNFKVESNFKIEKN